ncbi:unnamed protein product [Brassica rapa subsp. trilocularis]
MYQELNGKIVIPEKRLKWSQIPFQTVQEMKHTEKDGKCRVISTVYAIDTENGWYYFACVVCNNKVFKPAIIFDELNVPSWWCGFCQLNVTRVSPRYKLELLVQDPTGESKFSLADPVAKSILKTSATKVLLKSEDQEMLPPEIVEIVGKTFGFGISVENDDNFNAMKVWNLKDIMWKRIETLHQMSTASRKNQCTNVMKNDKLDREEYSDQKSG